MTKSDDQPNKQKNDVAIVNVNKLTEDFRRRARARHMANSESENVIPIRSESHDDDSRLLTLRDVVLLQIEFSAILCKHANPASNYMRGAIDVLICVMADARMPFDTWKDEISDEALAGLRRMKIDLRPELGAACDDALIDAALEKHPDWSKIDGDWEYHGDENTPHFMDDVISWFRQHYPHEAREIEQHFEPPADFDQPADAPPDPPPAA
jgi:hypothetical protein